MADYGRIADDADRLAGDPDINKNGVTAGKGCDKLLFILHLPSTVPSALIMAFRSCSTAAATWFIYLWRVLMLYVSTACPPAGLWSRRRRSICLCF